jgi:hypothetical protein
MPGADLFWSKDEAYLIINEKRLGYHQSPFKWALSWLAAVARIAAGRPADQRHDLIVIKLGNAVQRATIRNTAVVDWRTFEGTLYAKLLDGSLARLSGVNLQQVSGGRGKEPDSAYAKPRITTENETSDGWSHRPSLLFQGERRAKVVIRGVTWTIVGSATDDWQAIDVQPDNASPERVYEWRRERQWVTEQEYVEFLRD